MSAAMSPGGATHDPTTTTPAEQAAREGYAEMVRLLTRRSRGTHGGMRLGDPRDVMFGLTLDDATALFIDPFQMSRFRTLLIAGREGSGKQFIADLLRLRASWAYPGDNLRIVNATAAYWTEEARAARPDPHGWRFPAPPKKAKAPREGMVLMADHANGLAGHDGTDPVARGEWPSEATLFLRDGEGPTRLLQGEHPLLTEAEHEWLTRARMPAEAGYAEGLLVFGRWMWHLPIAVVASTPEYEFLTGHTIP